MSAAGRALPMRAADGRRSAPLLPAAVARLVAFAALAGFGGLRWAQMLQPARTGAALAVLLAALIGAALLVVVGRAGVPARARWGATALVGALLALIALAAAGVPGSLLEPRAWPQLAAGIAQGLSTVPTVRVPYGGLEEWTRIVLVLGGGALTVVAALVAFAPRRGHALGSPVAAALVLGVLYAVPVIQHEIARPFAAGLAFTALLALFLLLERVERRGAGLAAGLVLGACLLAFVAAPALDRDRALIDYEELAQSLGPGITTQYSWNHRYGPLDWPRDGREVLRVRARDRAYWKAVNLTVFDGLRWVQPDADSGAFAPFRIAERDWVQDVRVTVRALRSSQFVAAGTTLDVLASPRSWMPSGQGSFVTTDAPLRRGHAYRVRVYVPRPSAEQLRAAGSSYPPAVAYQHAVVLLAPAATTPGARRDRAFAVFAPFDAPSTAVGGDGGTVSAERALAASPYGEVHALARRLRAQARTPYGYMRAVERYLQRGFSYTETPRPSRAPLADFLLRDKAGYCQQFSGAMALLLRMGGVPARVASGFAPGVLDDERREYVVRDIDAHSWVEVYFPGIGWVTRDPTPADSPARSQTADTIPASGDAPVTLGGSARASDQRPAAGAAGAPAAAAPAADGRSRPWLLAVSLAAELLVVALVIALVVRRRRRLALRPRDAGTDRQLAELQRALRITGRRPAPATTLQTLARRYAGTPAEGYLRALAAQRYGDAGAPPSRTQRAGLRRELAGGLGLRGLLRAWWALPPRARGPRRRGPAA